jgi:hypothetical protein
MTYTQVWDVMKNQPHDGIIQRDEDGAFIPFDEGNKDYQEYLDWLDEGNEPAPPPAQPTFPIEEPPPPDIMEVHAQVQDIDARLSDLESQVTHVQETADKISRLTINSGSGVKNG